MGLDTPRLELRVLGTLDLRRRGIVVQSVLAQPKRSALLAYLLLARPRGYHQRDTLLNLLWGERTQERARKALRQALYYLRTTLGEDVILTVGDTEIAIAPDAIWSDVVALETALHDGRIEDALALYGGELLSGFFVDAAPEFQTWLDAERAHVRSEVVRAGWAAVESCAPARPAQAAALAARIVGIAPVDQEAGVRRLMELYVAAAAPAAALQVYRDFEARLASEYDLEPSAETRMLAEALTRRTREHASVPLPSTSPLGAGSVGRQVAERAGDASSEASRESLDIAAAPATARSLLRRRGSLWITAALVLIAVSAGLALAARDEAVPADPRLLVVLPFDVVGGDSTLADAARVVPFLFAQRLNGRVGPRTPDPADVVEALSGTARWRDRSRAARVLARRLGAGRAVIGGIGRSEHGLALSARLIDARTGSDVARAAVSGADDLDAHVDRLITMLLARAAAEPEQRIPHLAAAPVPALLWYLEGMELLRGGFPMRALDAFERALGEDSTFATAALGASIAGGATPTDWPDRGARHAWRWRSQLSTRDRDIVLAKLGPRYPAASSRAEILDRWDALVQTVGNDTYDYEILFGYADNLFHFGPYMGIERAHEQARLAFERADALGSGFSGALRHLADMALINGDTAGLRSAVERMLARAGNERQRILFQWLLAAGTSDTVLRARLPWDSLRQLPPLYNLPQQGGLRLDDAERVARLWRENATSTRDAINGLMLQWTLALNRGQPRRASALADTASVLARSTPHMTDVAAAIDRQVVRATLFWDGDTVAVAPYVARIVARAARAAPDSASYADRCMLEQWRLEHGDTRTVDDAVRVLDAAPQPGARLCARVLATRAAFIRGSANAGALLDSLNALARTVPPDWEAWFTHGNLIIARLYESDGRIADAATAIRRRGVFALQHNEHLSTYLREEGRLALAAGDTAGARRAWRHFLALHDAPEPERRANRIDVLRSMTWLGADRR